MYCHPETKDLLQPLTRLRKAWIKQCFYFVLAPQLPAPPQTRGDHPSQPFRDADTVGAQPLVVAVVWVSGPSSSDSPHGDQNDPFCRCRDIMADGSAPSAHVCAFQPVSRREAGKEPELAS